jgi:hypothetical protein
LVVRGGFRKEQQQPDARPNFRGGHQPDETVSLCETELLRSPDSPGHARADIHESRS